MGTRQRNWFSRSSTRDHLEVKGIQKLTDSVVNTLLVHKPANPVAHVVRFLAAERKKGFRRAVCLPLSTGLA